jgi:hypothetical protein
MLDLTQIARRSLETEPFAWAAIDGLYAPKAAAALAATYPRDHFKTLSGHDGEKEYLYEARALLSLGAGLAHAQELSGVWRELAHDLLSPDYRVTMSLLTGYDSPPRRSRRTSTTMRRERASARISTCPTSSSPTSFTSTATGTRGTAAA